MADGRRRQPENGQKCGTQAWSASWGTCGQQKQRPRRPSGTSTSGLTIPGPPAAQRMPHACTHLQRLHVALLQHLAQLAAKLGEEGRERHAAGQAGQEAEGESDTSAKGCASRAAHGLPTGGPTEWHTGRSLSSLHASCSSNIPTPPPAAHLSATTRHSSLASSYISCSIILKLEKTFMFNEKWKPT